MSLGEDKFYHTIACFVITIGTFIGLIIVSKLRKKVSLRRCRLHRDETSSDEEANDRSFCNDVNATAASRAGTSNTDCRDIGNVTDEGNGTNVPSSEAPSSHSSNGELPFRGDDDDDDDDDYGDENGHASSKSGTRRKTCTHRSVPGKFYVLAGIAGIFALLIGIIKEIGDHYDVWFLCKRVDEDGNVLGCHSSMSDVLADAIGIMIGEIFILGGLVLWFRFWKT